MFLQFLFKIGQLIGIAATISLAYGLSSGLLYEPNIYIKTFEVVGSVFAAIFLAMDFLNLFPAFD